MLVFVNNVKGLREDLKESVNRGLTLIEMLAVVVILAILIGITVTVFTLFGRVDGTELNANSKNVESAVLQVALADPNREIPADYDAGAVTIDDFDRLDMANYYKEFIVKLADDLEIDAAFLASLVFPLDPLRVEPRVSAGVDLADYFVVVKKSDVMRNLVEDGTGDSAAVGPYNIDPTWYYSAPGFEYNDALAGTVFTIETVEDSDNNIYNGSYTISSLERPSNSAYTGADFDPETSGTGAFSFNPRTR